jgi:transposase
LSRSKIAAALRKAGRQRNIDTTAVRIVEALRSEQLGLPDTLTNAYGASVRSLVAVITTMVEQIAVLEAEVNRCFGQHPDAEILTSQPGLGVILGARVLAEFGDAKDRYADAKARRNYAGTSPVTKASGTRRVVLARHARNRRLADALHQQAFAALTASPGARTFYDAHRARGATHHQALRTLANRLVGILDGCLRHRTTYDEATAWAHRQTHAA